MHKFGLSLMVIVMAVFLNIFGIQAQSSTVPMQIIFTGSYAGPRNIYSIHPDGTNLRRLEGGNGENITAACDRARNRIAFSSYFLTESRIETMNSSDGFNRISITTQADIIYSAVSPTWSPDGTRIAFADTRNGNPPFLDLDLYIMNADGSDITPLLVEDTMQDNPAWSPDGNRIAFSTILRVGGLNREIFVINPDGSNLTRITNVLGYDDEPAWSPDSSKIVFNSNRDGDDDIYMMNADGTNMVQLTNDPSYDFAPAWSPDGTQIAFTSGRSENGNAAIYVMNADGTNVQRVTDPSVDSFSPCWLPLTTTLNVGVSLQGRSTVLPTDTITGQIFSVVVSQGATIVLNTLITAVADGTSADILPVPNLPYGTYTVWIKHPRYLANTTTSGLNAPTVNASLFALRAGDADDNNLVNITDFSLLATTFGKLNTDVGYDPRADFNGDNVVNITDFSLLATNFGQSGTTAPGGTPALFSVLVPPPQLTRAALTLSASVASVKVNGTFTVTVRAGNSGSAAAGITASSIDGAQIRLDFDPATLRVESITPGTGLTTSLQQTFSNTAGTIDIAYGKLNGTVNNTFTVFTVQFRALASTGTTPTTLLTATAAQRETLITYQGATRAVTSSPLAITITAR